MPKGIDSLETDQPSAEALRPLICIVITFLIIDTLIVAARTVSRHALAKLSFWWDDLWIIVGYVLLMGMGAIILAMARLEIAHSKWDVAVTELDEFKSLAKMIYVYVLLLFSTFAATRCAILALYLRIFTSKRLRRAIWTVVCFVAIQYMAFSLVAIFSCWPVYLFWSPDAPPGTGKCFDKSLFYSVMTPLNMVVDIILITLPLPTVWGLKATRFRKWALTFVFGLGLLAMVVSAIRLAMLDKSQMAGTTSPSNTNSLFTWIFIEPAVYLMASCLPTMHHIFAAATPHKITEWVSRHMTWLAPPETKTAARTSVTNEPCGACDFNPYVGNDIDLEALGQETKVEVPETPVQPNGQRLSQLEGIMVTQVIEVVHEDRIAHVLGF